MTQGIQKIIDQGRAGAVTMMEYCVFQDLVLMHRGSDWRITGTQKSLAEDLRISSARFRQHVTKFRRLGWVRTWTGKNGTRYLMVNPDLYELCREPTRNAAARAQWEKLQAVEAAKDAAADLAEMSRGLAFAPEVS